MSANALVTTRISENIKMEASHVLKNMGLTISDAVRLTLTKIARDKSFPFDVREPNAETIAAMEDARAGKLKSFSSIEALMADLHAPD
jgi:DNA-damage-inducible protein J